ncbi:Uncharacterised protein [Vibrio cholerae]|uniref:Uncharacterized protein n=1 Tax=Vibrio cholerae TaxID=666 RepID=A0A655PXG7_VIBCL|nr:Uncharacterised protein [Vibrio cholerae]CSA24285.1 Uncharacterised protein [Vibrio cholerae]
MLLPSIGRSNTAALILQLTANAQPITQTFHHIFLVIPSLFYTDVRLLLFPAYDQLVAQDITRY